MKSMVIGGAGFIGSHIVDRLVELGHQTIVVDNLSSGRISNIKSHIDSKDVSFFSLDMRSESCFRLIKQEKPNYIFLLAAIPGVPISVENPSLTNNVNLFGVLNVLEAARGACDRIIFSSSSSIYGGSKNLPTPEFEKDNCKSPYALQKLTIEKYLKLYSELYDFDAVSLRYFNIFGPRQYPKSAYAAVISAFCKALKDDKAAIIHGDGGQFRDFTYVANAVSANILAATYDGELNGEVFNVGCGTTCSVKNLAKIMGINKVKHVETRAGDVKCSKADIEKIKNVLGYKVLITFNEGLESTIYWYMKEVME